MDFLREVESCIPALRRYARALLRDADSADDLVQDCLERALSRRHLWRPRGTVRAWLFTILHRLHANRRRAEAVRPPLVPIEAVAATATTADHAGAGSAAAGHGDRLALREVDAALLRLAPEQREALLLVALEGLSYREVARVQGVPVGTVMSRLSRGRDRLRALTQGGGGEAGATTGLRRVK